jgi:hypothetical protein
MAKYGHLLLTASAFGLTLMLAQGAVADLQSQGTITNKNDTSSMKALKAPARSGMEWDPDGKLTKIEFKFDDGSAWLRSNGDWYVKGAVRHNRLRCATYQLGVRFGHGNPACVNVEWLTEPRYVTSEKQCNSAIVPHEGGENDPALASEFERITCAERLIKCVDGTCD